MTETASSMTLRMEHVAWWLPPLWQPEVWTSSSWSWWSTTTVLTTMRTTSTEPDAQAEQATRSASSNWICVVFLTLIFRPTDVYIFVCLYVLSLLLGLCLHLHHRRSGTLCWWHHQSLGAVRLSCPTWTGAALGLLQRPTESGKMRGKGV